MIERILKHSSTSVIVRCKLRRSDTGQGLTGLAYNTTGLIISTICDNEATATTYTAAGSTTETISTLGTYAAPTATKCRFKEVDATNHPGTYEMQFANDRFAVASAKVLRISVLGAANLLEREMVFQLVSYDPDDTVRLGLTTLTSTAITTAAVATDGSNSATSFKTTLSSAVDNFWIDVLCLLTSGALAGQVKKVTDYDGTSKFLTVEDGFTSTPADDVTFALINR